MRPVAATLLPASPAERIVYRARPGPGALPAGTGLAIGMALPQLVLFAILLWAVWQPGTAGSHAFAVELTVALAAVNLVVLAAILRRAGPAARAVLRASFVELSVSDRRVAWRMAGARAPLFAIEPGRIVGVHSGDIDTRGRGNVAIRLVPGDFAADVDGCVHVDRVPRLIDFVAAVEALIG